MKKIILLILLICISSQLVYGDDNASSGNGNVSNALKNKGYYRTNEFMYKVSLYVALSDTVNEYSSINSSYKMIGNEPLYIKPTSFSLPANLVATTNNKIDYLNGKVITNKYLNTCLSDKNVPAIPITNYGRLSKVKSYFGDTNTLAYLIDEFAKQKGTTAQGLVSNMEFTIDGVKGMQNPSDILPLSINGVYTNKVCWLVVYEPVTILYLKPDSNGYRQPIAYTATEYALDQRDGYFDFFWGSNGQFVAGMTHSDLPNSIVLEESWVGLQAYAPLPDGTYWSNDRSILGGGIGMRLLRPGEQSTSTETLTDIEYRTDTDVITSLTVFANGGDITPDKRHLTNDTRSTAYTTPEDNKAYVNISVNGNTLTEEVVLASGTSREVWLKWHTPSEATTLSISVSVTGNPSATIQGIGRNGTVQANIVNLNKNIPPDTSPHDDSIKNIPNAPNKADNKTTSWNTSSAYWKEEIEWFEKLVWHENLVWVDTSYIDIDEYGEEFIVPDGHWKDIGEYVDEGWFVDNGKWVFEYQEFSASLNASIDVVPDIYCKTAIARSGGYTMKSGYGINMKVISSVTGIGEYTQAQTSVSYFPEFDYKEYWRLLERTSSGVFEFRKNEYSTYYNRVHFTPFKYPDGRYEVYNVLRDAWTPGGELYMDFEDLIEIEGNVYDDWSIVPDIVER